MSNLRALWRHLAGAHQENGIGNGQRRMITERQLADILTSSGTLKLGSNMLLPIPEIRMPKTNKPLPRALVAELQTALFRCFGINQHFVNRFAAFLEKDKETLGVNISRFEVFVNSLRSRGYNPGKLLPVLSTMLTDQTFCSVLKRPQDLASVLRTLERMVADGKDPIKETSFDFRVEMLMRRMLDQMPLRLFMDQPPAEHFVDGR